MAKWQAWVADLGGAAVNPGTPLMNTRIVSASSVSDVSDGGGDRPMLGFSVVTADTTDAAFEMANACPFLDTGGTLEVAEMMDMPKPG